MSEYLEDDNTEQLLAEYDDHEAYEEAYVPERDLPIFFYIKKNKADKHEYHQ